MTRRPPTPDGLPFLGHTVEFAADPFGFIDDLLADHGVDGAVGLDILGMDEIYVLAHPDHFERTLVTNRDAVSKGDEFDAAFGDGIFATEGDKWRRQRDKLDPFFRWDRVSAYVPQMREQVERRLTEWPDEGTLSAESEMKNLTLDIIFVTILGRELELDGDDRLRHAADSLNERFTPSSWVLPDWIPTPSRRRFDKAKDILREEIQSLVETADKGSLAAQLATALGSDYPETIESMEDQLIGIIFAGHESTALALTFTFYALATNPDIHDRATREVDRVVGDGPVTAGALDDLAVLERIIKESLRLYPPIHTIPRETTRSFSVGECTIPAGTDVQLSVLRLHRDERWYDDPLEFRPERWTEASDRPKYAYLPFGAGPRSCLGRAFALTEAKLVLATVLREFELEWGTDEPLGITPEMTTQPDGATPLVVRRR
ncbi:MULTISPECIES: cytochrome P450 [Haloferax]|uniref:Cytochrome P450 n=2 Tax=Haloferax TaxID=2251 RepID=A0A6G1Z3H1_9EURY|nr:MULTISPECIES: cytochrome P450 [Haloferax]KAB1188404.1 cytochrome P450 [Haloferax sp. CBA1149]MRW81096.1 cytochrome P450 [Haloferax marinisediminis]